MIVFLCASDLVAILLFFFLDCWWCCPTLNSVRCVCICIVRLYLWMKYHIVICVFSSILFFELIVWNSVGYGRRILFDCSVLRCKYFYTILNSLSRLTSQQRCDTYHRIRSFCSRFYMNNFFKRSSLIFFSIYLHFYSAIFMVSVFEQ